MNIKKGIKTYLKKHPKADYFVRCIRFSRNPEYVNAVLGINQDPRTVKYEVLGNLNDDQIIYLIHPDNFALGFFALLAVVLDGLYFAEQYHMVPVVEYDAKCLYNENHEINGGTNAFEYFFEAVSSITIEDAKQSSKVVRYKQCHRNLDGEITVLGNYLENGGNKNEYMKKRAELFAKYVHFKPQVEEYLNTNIENILGKSKCIGVHVRGTDFNKGYINHAKVVTLQQYIDAVDEAVAQYGFEKIFLATDEESTVTAFKNRYGDKVVFFEDSFRSTDGQAVHFSSVDRPDHKYRMGLEVLRDMYALANCAGLVCGYSNVSIMAQIVKMSMRKEYEYLNIICNGFNEKGKTCYNDRK